MDIGGTFWGLMQQGGAIMWPLLAFSIVAVAVSIERFISLRRAKINVNEFLAKVRQALVVNRSIRDAIKVCEQYRGPVASIMKAGLLKYGQPKEDVEKTIEAMRAHIFNDVILVNYDNRGRQTFENGIKSTLEISGSSSATMTTPMPTWAAN